MTPRILNKFLNTPAVETSGFNLGKNMNYITPEMRAYASEYTDPLTLNFKLLINYNKPYGLFAPETNINSALAYLKRIGQDVRYEMLKQWIIKFQDFVKNYDFLILGCEGLEVIFNMKPPMMFTGEEKVTIAIRETSDMRFQSLLTMYNKIWYDDVRICEIIPVNLRRFDMSILIYSAGYYNMALYDINENNSNQDSSEINIFPTLAKIGSTFFNTSDGTSGEYYYFNHHLINLGDAEINIEDSGAGFFGNLSNEQAPEPVKNSFSVNYRFARFNGMFNNIFGEFDFVKLLAISAAQDNVSNKLNNKLVVEQFKKSMKDSFNKAGKSIAKSLATKVVNLPSKFLSKNTAIGNALYDVSQPQFVASTLKSAADLGITVGEDWVNGKIANVTNLVQMNFSNTFNKIYDDVLGHKQGYANSVKVSDTPIQSETMVNQTPTTNLINPAQQTEIYTPSKTSPYVPGIIPPVKKGIRLSDGNIYDRKSF